MNQDNLSKILDSHSRWLKEERGHERANLSCADLCQANLRDANIKHAKLPYFQICPSEGSFVAFKQVSIGCHYTQIVRLLIPKSAQRTSSLVGRKCRASHAIVLQGEGCSIFEHSFNKLEYIPGRTVVADWFDPDIRVECAKGIHFFMTRQEADEF